ncbi:hypothetical protein N0V91_001221 [Didymella pomorum]|uniref:Uncharacterized protein n=1 Tax=Didymella pomorum TaxID=749634 RepID=A0A9W8ZMP8_9PLEO|nr:hypothetical protein N0V91_001221 [Didymella pomorum]
MSSFSNRHRYSRSSVSLSRPHRLSSVTPVTHLECSSRSDTLNSSGGISEAGESPISKAGSGISQEKRASAAEIVYAIINNTPIPSTSPNPRKHLRTVSAPNTSPGAQQKRAASNERMAIGWKPTLSNSKSSIALRKPLPIALNKLVRSASAELLGRFGPVASADAVDKMAEMKWKKDFEREIEDRLNDLHNLPFPDEEAGEGKKSMSTDADTLRGSYERTSIEDETRFEDAKEVLGVSTRPSKFTSAARLEDWGYTTTPQTVFPLSHKDTWALLKLLLPNSTIDNKMIRGVHVTPTTHNGVALPDTTTWFVNTIDLSNGILIASSNHGPVFTTRYRELEKASDSSS